MRVLIKSKKTFISECPSGEPLRPSELAGIVRKKACPGAGMEGCPSPRRVAEEGASTIASFWSCSQSSFFSRLLLHSIWKLALITSVTVVTNFKSLNYADHKGDGFLSSHAAVAARLSGRGPVGTRSADGSFVLSGHRGGWGS